MIRPSLLPRQVVSVWMFDKKQLDHLKGPAKELVLEVLRKEVSPALASQLHGGIRARSFETCRAWLNREG